MSSSSNPDPLPISISHRAQQSSGSAISYLMQQAVENRGVLSLAAGLVDESSLPVTEARTACEEFLADPARARGALQYGHSSGFDELRTLIRDHFAELEGGTLAATHIPLEQIVLTTGSQQFLQLVAEALFDPGDICLVSAPTYFVFLGVLQGVGAKVIAIPADEHGMRIDLLSEKLTELDASGELPRVKAIYIVSDFENPSGICLSADRRAEVVRLAQLWSRKDRIFVLEDSAYRELRYDGASLPSVWSFDEQRHTLIYTQTFSKSFSPGVRVGFGILPEGLVRPILDLKGNHDFGSPSFNQHLLATVMRRGLYRPHVIEVCASYRAKRDALLRSLAEHLGDVPGVTWVHPHGGLYVWLTLPDCVTTSFDSPLFQRAAKVDRVMYVPGELCYPASGIHGNRPRNQMRLSFGVLSPADLAEAAKRLATAIKFILSNPDR